MYRGYRRYASLLAERIAGHTAVLVLHVSYLMKSAYGLSFISVQKHRIRVHGGLDSRFKLASVPCREWPFAALLPSVDQLFFH